MYNASIEDPQATNALRTYIVNDLKKLQKVMILFSFKISFIFIRNSPRILKSKL